MHKDIFITLVGRVPSKKNSRITTRTGRSFPSKAYSAWHVDASSQLLGAPIPRIKPEKVESIHIRFWSADKRKFDLTNKAESIMDLLVDNDIILDDNFSVVPKLSLDYMGVLKGGKTEVDIYLST